MPKVLFKHIEYWSLFLVVMVLLWFNFLGQVPANTGDGLSHYFISWKSWEYHELFLDHWGKPLFTILSSPFSQFGFQGLVIFNIVVFFLTVLLSFRILDHFKVPKIYGFLLPLLLLSIPEVLHTIMGGLTEPLFGLIGVAAGLSLVKRRWTVFAVLVSFLPYSRSEGMLMLIVALVVLLLLKKYKSIPFLFLGSLLFILLGAFFINDPLWYFHNDPYPFESPYGKGEWWHYILYAHEYLGIAGLLLLIPFALFLIQWKTMNLSQDLIRYGIFATVSFFGIVGIHALLWTFGLKGAYGLLRLGTHGVYLFVPLLLITYYQVTLLDKLKRPILASVSVLLFGFTIYSSGYPKKLEGIEKTMSTTTDYILEHQDKVGAIHYDHPFFHYLFDRTRFDYSEKFVTTHFEDTIKAKKVLKEGDLVIRDSHSGVNALRLTREHLKNYPELVRVKTFIKQGEVHLDKEGNQWRVDIYQVQKHRKKTKTETLLWKKDQTITLTSSEEFSTILDSSKLELSLDFNYTVVLEGHLKSRQSKMVFPTIGDEPLTQRKNIGIQDPGAFSLEMELFGHPKHLKVFVHNPDKINGEIYIDRLRLLKSKMGKIKWIQH